MIDAGAPAGDAEAPSAPAPWAACAASDLKWSRRA